MSTWTPPTFCVVVATVWSASFGPALVEMHRVLDVFRARFVGKASPVHPFWRALDRRRRTSPSPDRRAHPRHRPASTNAAGRHPPRNRSTTP